MAKNALTDYIISEGERRYEKTLNEARARVGVLRTDLENKLAQLRQDALEMLDKELREYRIHEISKAHIRVKELGARARGEVRDELIRQTGEAISSVIEGPAYPEILRKLLMETLQAMSGRVTVLANSRDCPMIRDLLKGASTDIMSGLSCEITSVIPDDRIPGGIEITTDDESMSIINTLSSRLERMGDEIMPEIRDILFAKGE